MVWSFYDRAGPPAPMQKQVKPDVTPVYEVLDQAEISRSWYSLEPVAVAEGVVLLARDPDAGSSVSEDQVLTKCLEALQASGRFKSISLSSADAHFDGCLYIV